MEPTEYGQILQKLETTIFPGALSATGMRFWGVFGCVWGSLRPPAESLTLKEEPPRPGWRAVIASGVPSGSQLPESMELNKATLA